MIEAIPNQRDSPEVGDGFEQVEGFRDEGLMDEPSGLVWGCGFLESAFGVRERLVYLGSFFCKHPNGLGNMHIVEEFL